VASFTHVNGLESSSAFTAIINWGDGKTSVGTITQSGATYTVVGSHRYSKAGSHTIKTTVSEVGNQADLLLAKVGDEVPALPDRWPIPDNHYSAVIDLATLLSQQGGQAGSSALDRLYSLGHFDGLGLG
jgi:hypothetical protein